MTLKLNKDLALLLVLSSAFVLEDNYGEDGDKLINKAKGIFDKYGINIDVDFEQTAQSDEEFLNWLDKTAAKLQLAIEEYEALERED